jgi:hypothetical protein
MVLALPTQGQETVTEKTSGDAPKQDAADGLVQGNAQTPSSSAAGATSGAGTGDVQTPESIKVKVGLTIFEIVVLGGLAFFFGRYLNDLSKLQDVKWDQEKIECLTPTCDVGKLKAYTYKFGDPLKNVKLVFAVKEAKDFEIISGSVQRYEVSILNFISTKKYIAEGRLEALPKDDPERNNTTTFEFNLNELSPNQIYEMGLILKDKNRTSFNNYGHFEIRDADNRVYDAKGLGRTDYLRLYLTEVIVISAIVSVLILAVGFILIWKGPSFFSRRKF